MKAVLRLPFMDEDDVYYTIVETGELGDTLKISCARASEEPLPTWLSEDEARFVRDQIDVWLRSLEEARQSAAVKEEPKTELHRHQVERAQVFTNGEGPDEAAAMGTCACGAYRWLYCDGTRSDWKSP